MITENLYTADCVRTFSGIYVNVINPTVDMFTIDDIAHALSNQCRFNGHLPKFYSVAQHSVMAALEIQKRHMICRMDMDMSDEDFNHYCETLSTFKDIWDYPDPPLNDLILSALMHDASEAYLADIPSPLKHHLDSYKIIEDQFMKVISEKFNFTYPLLPEIKVVDKKMLEYEWNNVMLEPTPIVECWSQEKSKEEFLKIYNQLCK